jgi:hypothetical protein
MPTGDKRRVTLTAPVLPFEYPWSEDDVIWACHDCLPWHLELFRDPATGALWVREWHAEGCPIWEDVESERPQE